MARYMVQKELMYRLNGEYDDHLILHKGDVVQGVMLRAIPRKDAGILRNAEKRSKKRTEFSPKASRLVFFRAHGVYRYANAIEDLLPTRKAINVPLEIGK
jgi:hypothetical protein